MLPFVIFQDGVRSSGHLRGLILRSQLIVLLKNKTFNAHRDDWANGKISMKMFRKAYPRYPDIDVSWTLLLL